jgi:hypothetical protein
MAASTAHPYADDGRPSDGRMHIQASGHFVAAVVMHLAKGLRPLLGHWSGRKPNRIVDALALHAVPESKWIAFG